MSDSPRVPPLSSADSGADELVRRVLDAATDHEPSIEQLSRLSDRLAAALPPGALATGASATAAKTASLALVGKISAGVVVASMVGGGLWYASKPRGTPETAPVISGPTLVAETAPLPVASTSPSSSSADAPASAIAPASSPIGSATVAAPAPTESEAAMLARAHEQLLHGSASSALATVAETAKAYPRGSLSQEREMITIEALAKSGRGAEARARAEAFRKAYPKSSYVARLDSLFGATTDAGSDAASPPRK